MSTLATILSGASAPASAPKAVRSTSELALWNALGCDAFAADRSGLWFDFTNPLLYHLPVTGETISAFYWLDRIGGRRARSGLSGKRPVVATDSISGKLCAMFGAPGITDAGVDAPALTAAANGDLGFPSRLVSGVETNIAPLFIATRGFSAFLAARVPAPSTAMNGSTFGATVGGTILGGAKDLANTHLDFVTSTGKLLLSTNASSSFQAATDRRTGAWTLAALSYNPATKIGTIVPDSETGTPVVSGATITDFSTDPDEILPRIGGRGKASLSSAFAGALAVLVVVPLPALTAAQLAAGFAFLRERTTAS